MSTFKLNVSTASDAVTNKITYNFPLKQYTLGSDGSGTFDVSNAITMNDVNYSSTQIFLFSNRDNLITDANTNKSFVNKIEIVPSSVSGSLSPNLAILNEAKTMYSTVSHLLVIRLVNTSDTNQKMNFVIPVSYVSTNNASDNLDNLIVDISGAVSGANMTNFVDFNEIIKDGHEFYHYADPNGTVTVFCQDVYFSRYLVNPPIDVLKQQAKIASEAVTMSTSTIFTQDGASTFLKTEFSPGVNTILLTTCNNVSTGKAIYDSILARIPIVTSGNLFNKNTLNLSINANSDYDFIGCTIIDNGVTGKTPADTVEQAVVQTQTSAMLSMAVGVVLAIAAIVVSPTIHQLIVTKMYGNPYFRGPFLKVYRNGQSDYIYKTVPEGGVLSVDVLGFFPNQLGFDGKPFFKHGGDFILTATYVFFIFVFLGMGWSETNFADGDISYSVQNKINYKITAILMIVLLFVIPAYIRMYYATNASP